MELCNCKFYSKSAVVFRQFVFLFFYFFVLLFLFFSRFWCGNAVFSPFCFFFLFPTRVLWILFIHPFVRLLIYLSISIYFYSVFFTCCTKRKTHRVPCSVAQLIQFVRLFGLLSFRFVCPLFLLAINIEIVIPTNVRPLSTLL